MNNAATNRWRITGTSRSGNTASVTLRAKDYHAAVAKAVNRHKLATVRDVVLIDEDPEHSRAQARKGNQ